MTKTKKIRRSVELQPEIDAKLKQAARDLGISKNKIVNKILGNIDFESRSKKLNRLFGL